MGSRPDSQGLGSWGHAVRSGPTGGSVAGWTVGAPRTQSSRGIKEAVGPRPWDERREGGVVSRHASEGGHSDTWVSLGWHAGRF